MEFYKKYKDDNHLIFKRRILCSGREMNRLDNCMNR